VLYFGPALEESEIRYVTNAALCAPPAYERDPETGLDYAFARYYDSRLGRFLSADPMAGAITNPQSLNRYAYAVNNPANFTDPSGALTFPCSIYSACSEIGSDPFFSWLGWTPIFLGVAEGWWSGPGREPEYLQGLPIWRYFITGTNAFPCFVSKTCKVQLHFKINTACSKNAQQVISDAENNLPQFADFSGKFGPMGLPLGHADVQFGSVPVTQGATIPISLSGEVYTGGPDVMGTFNFNVSVNVISASANGFTFTTNPGHLLYPASISFSATDTGPGQIGFSIDIAGDYANAAMQTLFAVGGSDLESKQWNSFLKNVVKDCK